MVQIQNFPKFHQMNQNGADRSENRTRCARSVVKIVHGVPDSAAYVFFGD
jgi:hypothetical protein